MHAAVYHTPVSMEEPFFLSTVSFTKNQGNLFCRFPATHYCVQEQFSISLLKCNYNLQRSIADKIRIILWCQWLWKVLSWSYSHLGFQWFYLIVLLLLSQNDKFRNHQKQLYHVNIYCFLKSHISKSLTLWYNEREVVLPLECGLYSEKYYRDPLASLATLFVVNWLLPLSEQWLY